VGERSEQAAHENFTRSLKPEPGTTLYAALTERLSHKQADANCLNASKNINPSSQAAGVLLRAAQLSPDNLASAQGL
jgi:hypothetical protein